MNDSELSNTHIRSNDDEYASSNTIRDSLGFLYIVPAVQCGFSTALRMRLHCQA